VREAFRALVLMYTKPNKLYILLSSGANSAVELQLPGTTLIALFDVVLVVIATFCRPFKNISSLRVKRTEMDSTGNKPPTRLT
jgi:hypothetical protein